MWRRRNYFNILRKKNKQKRKELIGRMLHFRKQQFPTDNMKKIIDYTIRRVILKKKPDNEFINFCITSYYLLGLDNYCRLAKKLKLIPLRYFFHFFFEITQFHYGLNPRLLQLIRLKFECLPERDRICALTIEELRLDDANVQQVVDMFGTSTARYAVVFFIRGLFVDCHIPVFYYPSQRPAPVEDLIAMLLVVLDKMKECRLDVQVVVTLFVENMMALAQSLRISLDNPVFTYKQEKYCFMFDFSHLISFTWDFLITSQLHYNGQHTCWKYIEIAAAFCSVEGRPPMLHYTNFIDQLITNDADKYLQNLLDRGKLPQEAKGTIAFVSLFTELARLIYSTRHLPAEDYAFTGSKSQMECLKKCDEYFDKVRIFADDQFMEDDSIFKYAWRVSIRALAKLFVDINRKLKSERPYQYIDLFPWRITIHDGLYPAFFHRMPALRFLENIAYCTQSALLEAVLSRPLGMDVYFELIGRKFSKMLSIKNNKKVYVDTTLSSSTSESEEDGDDFIDESEIREVP